MNERVVDGFRIELLDSATMRVIWAGEATEAAVLALRDFTATCKRTLGPEAAVNVLIDASQGTAIPRAARKAFAQLGRERYWERAAFVGVRFEMRVVIEMMTKALELLDVGAPRMTFVNTQAEALAWFQA